jgi:chemotaxis protein histidine kinase CheA
MSDGNISCDEFDMSELSEADLAVIQAFEAMDVWSPEPSPYQAGDRNKMLAVPQACSSQQDGEMFLIFAVEAETDISSIRQILNQLAQDEAGDLALFLALKRAGHKLHGTAGAVGFPLISTVAGQIELIAEGVLRTAISSHFGIAAISAATTVLEACLQVITSMNRELEAPLLLTSLEAVYQSLDIDPRQLEGEQVAATQIDAGAEKLLPSTPPLHFDAQGPEPLTAYTGPLVASTVEDTHRRVFCFLVQVGDQHLLIPFNQVQCIGNRRQEQTAIRYSLQELLGFPDTTSEASLEPMAEPRESTSQYLPLLILCSEDETMEERTTGIVVDEIVGEQECTLEPLPAYLQRPGIAGVTIDSGGRVLLVVDLLELIRFTRCK